MTNTRRSLLRSIPAVADVVAYLHSAAATPLVIAEVTQSVIGMV